MRPLAIDLFCGLGGWAEGLLAKGWQVIGFDIERHQYGEHRYPAQLVIQDVLTLHGSQFRDAGLIVASPPCQEYSYMAMPWTRAKAIAAEYRSGKRDVATLNELFDTCFRIQREACAAAGRHIPMVVENVRGAQPWVGRSRWNWGSYFLWGDVPALMPTTSTYKIGGGAKVEGIGWTGFADTGASWRNREQTAQVGHPNIRDGHDHTRHLTNPGEHGVEQHGSGEVWFDTGLAALPSSSPRRKAASAMIAKIPLPLAQHIARVFLPPRRAAA